MSAEQLSRRAKLIEALTARGWEVGGQEDYFHRDYSNQFQATLDFEDERRSFTCHYDASEESFYFQMSNGGYAYLRLVFENRFEALVDAVAGLTTGPFDVEAAVIRLHSACPQSYRFDGDQFHLVEADEGDAADEVE